MKKKATLIIALAAAFSCTAAFAGPADSSRWTIDGDYAIRWDIGNDIPHYDHIEMSGEQVSVVYRYGVNEDGSFAMDRSVVWPMLRTVPNDTHASLTVHFDTDFMSGVTIDGKALEGEKVRSITLDGIMSVLSTYGNAPVEVTECYFPSPTRAAVCERYTITNTGEEPLSIFAVVSSCGCTGATWPHEAIEPGESGEISASFTNDEGPYPFDKVLTVYTSAQKKPILLHMKGVATK